jgi:hypothetical protein
MPWSLAFADAHLREIHQPGGKGFEFPRSDDDVGK